MPSHAKGAQHGRKGRYALALALIGGGVLGSGVGWAQPFPPGVDRCPSNRKLNVGGSKPATQCVVPAPLVTDKGGPAACSTKCGGPPGKWVWLVNCWDSLDDAVHADAAINPVGPEPPRVIAVFGPTQETVGFLTTFCSAPPKLPPSPRNVIIDRNPCLIGGAVYPLQIEECHNAKIGGAGLFTGDPVIEIWDNPVGPVSINGVETSGGDTGIEVMTSTYPTILKGVRAEANLFNGFDVSGIGNILNGCSGEGNGNSGFRIGGSNNIVKNTNRAFNNAMAGFDIVGDANLVRGNIASLNGRDGFIVVGNSNSLRDNRANGNLEDGFDISGNVNSLEGNVSNQGSDGSADDNARCEYDFSTPVMDLGGNKADGLAVPRLKCPAFPAPAPPPPGECTCD